MTKRAPPPPRKKRSGKRPIREPARPAAVVAPRVDPLVGLLAGHMQRGHGHDKAAVMALAEEIGRPRGFIPTGNVALDRAVGNRGGVPMGRFIEISGWERAGKSTMLDQIIAQCQRMGGIAMLADTERARDRPYMESLGVDPSTLLWAMASTAEEMFNEVETFARGLAHQNTWAWVEALRRAGVKCPDPKLVKHTTFSTEKVKTKTGRDTRKKIAEFSFAQWGADQAAALVAYQQAQGLVLSGYRDVVTRERLRPVILMGSDADEQADALDCWERHEAHPYAIAADRPVVIGWDSVAGTPTDRERTNDAYDVTVADMAKAIRRNFRRLVMDLSDQAICFVMTNQRYTKVETGQAAFTSGPPKSETYGGGGIKFHATVRIELTRIGGLWRTDTDRRAHRPPMGQITKIFIDKNKVGAPSRTETYGLVNHRGADNAYAIFEDLASRGIIAQGGGWYRFTDSSILESEPGGNKNWQSGWMGLSDLMADPQYPGLWGKMYRLYMEGL